MESPRGRSGSSWVPAFPREAQYAASPRPDPASGPDWVITALAVLANLAILASLALLLLAYLEYRDYPRVVGSAIGPVVGLMVLGFALDAAILRVRKAESEVERLRTEAARAVLRKP